MACKTLARLCHEEKLEDEYMQTNSPVISSILPLCMAGNDDTGNKLLSLLEKCGSACRNVDTRVVKDARTDKSGLRTALSVLPIYRDGRRGCFFDAASNESFSADQLISMFSKLSTDKLVRTLQDTAPVYGALLFGYPHLLPMMQGESLGRIFRESRKIMIDSGIVALDLNGVPEAPILRKGMLRSLEDLRSDFVIGPALEHVDILHMNEDELELLTGCPITGIENEDQYAIAKAAELFLACGVAVVAVTRGRKGSYVACSDEERFERSPLLPVSWINCSAHVPAALLPPGTLLNTNGAGDSFVSGLLVAALIRHTGMSVPPPPQESDRLDAIKEEKDFPSPRLSSSGKKMTPYNLYMQENYTMLKQQCEGDKKAMFTMCHEMWKNEKRDVKRMYERMAREESDEPLSNVGALDRMSDVSALQSHLASSMDSEDREYYADESLTLEAAVMFAGLVAAHHVNVSTRDLDHLDVTKLLEKAIAFPSGEI